MPANPVDTGFDLVKWLPIFISVIALAMSAFNLGWNIYKDAIRKPRFRVSVAIKTIVQPGAGAAGRQGTFMFVEALNLGPSANRIGTTFITKGWFRRWFRKSKDNSAFLMPDHGHYAATPAAARIEVGDKAIFVFPVRPTRIFADGFVRIGVSDGFGQMHWAPKKELAEVRSYYEKHPPDKDVPA